MGRADQEHNYETPPNARGLELAHCSVCGMLYFSRADGPAALISTCCYPENGGGPSRTYRGAPLAWIIEPMRSTLWSAYLLDGYEAMSSIWERVWTAHTVRAVLRAD